MRELIRGWFNINNGHPNDDERFYEIVKNSIEYKVEIEVFTEVLREIRQEITDDEIARIYCRYEDLRNCLIYYIRNNANEESQGH